MKTLFISIKESKRKTIDLDFRPVIGDEIVISGKVIKIYKTVIVSDESITWAHKVPAGVQLVAFGK